MRHALSVGISIFLSCILFLSYLSLMVISAYSQDMDGTYVVGDDNHRVSIHGDRFSLLSIPPLLQGKHCAVSDETLSKPDNNHLKGTYRYTCGDSSLLGAILIDTGDASLSFTECISMVSNTSSGSDNCMITLGGFLKPVPESDDVFPDKDRYNLDYCNDYHPGGRYMTITVPDDISDHPERTHTDSQISGALAQTYFEQLGLIALSDDYPQLSDGVVVSPQKAAETAMGFDASGPGIVLPFNWKFSKVDVKVKVLDTDDISAFSESNDTVFITKGLIKRIVKNAAVRNFGSEDIYAKHLSSLLAATIRYPHRDGKINVIDGDVEAFDDNAPNDIPIGALVYSWRNVNDASNYGLSQLDGFAMDVSSALFFVGAHEAGHLVQKHHDIVLKSCEDFSRIELEADAYASHKLASFIYGVMPLSDDNFGTLINQRHFFEIYDSLGFSDRSMNLNCAYPPSSKRLEQLNLEFFTEYNKLRSITMPSTRYDQAFGGASCYNKEVTAGSLNLNE